MSFWKYWLENSLTPKCLRFKVLNWSLNLSEAYKQCQIRLLKEEISNKKSIFRKRESELVLLKNHLQASMNVIDYAHFSSIFLISNEKILTEQKDIQDRKTIGLLNEKVLIQKMSFFTFQFLTSLKFGNTFALLSYITMNSVILSKIAVIKNFPKVSWNNWACIPIVDWNIMYLKKSWAKGIGIFKES